ncbi:unnamed protein product [Paramecium primaurelia]|uniref:Phosphatidylinositol N-acetylglucosaminyltransferase subunit H conserved domain-containing protein n=1 Tax=Paramecium primaurelia TaxID=5886 RepID=A0A8S1K8D8_PARPR|nr:unnamed protein product [Paramecium primaurelia]
MLKFSGEFNHAYIITYERKPKLYKKLIYLNLLLFVIISWLQFNLQQTILITIIYNILIYIIGGNEIIIEQMQIIKNIGIQIEKRKSNGSVSREFINQNIIRDVVLQEGLTTFTVEIYLAIICKGMKQMILPFQYNLSTDQLMQIYYPLRQMIM